MNRKKIETLLGFFTILFVLLPLLAHLPANDNHLNLANHHYGQNLMNTLEPWSIFMTEGGDNQVFTSAYNQMAEQLRPDVRIYDQKGNVFYRIYGDFRFMTRQEVDIKRNVVDYEIFHRGRPVYLTWHRQPSVAACGDWYLKRYGILFKVTPLRYRILEDLGADVELSFDRVTELIRGYYKEPGAVKEMQDSLKALEWYIPAVQQGTIETGNRYNQQIHFMNNEEKNRIQKNVLLYRDYLKKALARKIDAAFVRDLLRGLEQEGYLQVQGQTVKFVKPLAAPMQGDYWQAYADRSDYSKIPNSVEWDYLTREIFTNYNFYLAQYARERQDYFTRRLAYYKRKLQQQPGNALLRRQISDAEKQLEHYRKREAYAYQQAEYYGYDMTPICHNLGAIFTQRGDLKKAMELYRKGVEADKYSYPTVVAYIQTGLQYYAAKRDAAGEEAFLKEADRLISRTLPLIKHREGVNDQNLKNDRNYRTLMSIRQMLIAPRKQYPLSKVEVYRKAALAQPANLKAWDGYFRILSIRRDFEMIVDTFKTIPDGGGWKDPGLLYSYGTALYSTGKHDDAINVFRRTVQQFPLYYLGLFRLGELLQYRGLTAEAVQVFNRLSKVPKQQAVTKYPLYANHFDSLVQAAQARAAQLSK